MGAKCPALALRVAASVFVLYAAGPGTAWAQAEGVVRGQVVAAADRSPVAGAAMTLTAADGGEALQNAADAGGRFGFLHVRPGEYILTAGADGFSTRSVRLTLEPREVRTITLPLDVGGVAVSVRVTGDAAALAATHSPSSTVLTAEQLTALPAAQRTSLPDTLVTLAPGMIRGHDDFVHIRGHEVALNPLINGVSFWENPHALFSGGLSPDIIETASVMTGGFSAEYGNRFGGVVDIVTKSGFHMHDKGTVTVNGGQAGRRGVSAEAGGAGEHLGYYLFGTGYGSDRFLSPPDPRAIHDHGRGARAFGQIDWRPDAGGSLRTIVAIDGADIEIPKTPIDVELRRLADASQRGRQQTFIAGWTRAWSRTLVSASAYQRWSRTRLLPAGGPLTARAGLVRELLTVGVKADVTRTAGRHAIKAGADAVRLSPRETLSYDYGGYRDLTHLLGLPHLHVAGQTIAFAGREAGGQVSVYVQDALQLGGRVTADLGVRVDRYDLLVAATHASPRANVAIQAGGTVLHASYNRFFVPPPIEGVLSSSAGLTRFIQEIAVGLPALKPTTEDQIETGVTAPLGPLSLAMTGYARATEHPVHTTVWPDARIYSYASFDRARAYGLELKASVPGLARYGLSGYANYALGRVDFYNPVTGGFVTDTEHITATNRFLAPMDQTHTFTGGLTYHHARSGAWIGTAVEYGSGTPIGHGGAHEHAAGTADHDDAAARAEDGRVPGHAVANLSLGLNLFRNAGRRSRLVLQVDIENAGDSVYLVAQEGAFSPTQYSIPRLVSITARLRF